MDYTNEMLEDLADSFITDPADDNGEPDFGYVNAYQYLESALDHNGSEKDWMKIIEELLNNREMKLGDQLPTTFIGDSIIERILIMLMSEEDEVEREVFFGICEDMTCFVLTNVHDHTDQEIDLKSYKLQVT